MKKIILVFYVILFSICSSNAIDWLAIHEKNGKVSYIDTDSIVKTDKYYFYNIKYTTPKDETLVITMQSALSSPFSARIKIYKVDEYNNLNGNYEHIQDNQTEKLEPVYYGSVVNASYKYVKTIYTMKNNEIMIGE